MLLSLLFFTAFLSKAQSGGYIEYRPAQRPVSGGDLILPDFSISTPNLPRTPPPTTRSKSLLSSAILIDAYYFDIHADKPVKIKLKVIENDYGVFIVGHRKIADEYWNDISSTPLKASKLSTQNKLSEYFEFSTYLNTRTVYF